MPKQTQLTWTDRALLSRALHRLLFKRLLGMTLAVCILTACGFYLVERARFTATLRDNVLFSAARFQLLAQEQLNTPGLGDHKRLQDILDNFMLYGQQQQQGAAATLTLMDTQGRVAASRRNPAFNSAPELDGYLEAKRYQLPAESGGVLYELVFLGPRPFLHILIPFANAKGNAVAYGECLFAIRESVIHDANLRMGLTLALAVSLVLATSGLLYPVLLRLLRQMHTNFLDLLEANLESLSVLSRASAKRDSDVDSHSYRVTIYAVRLGERMALDRQAMRSLIKGAFLHDVGKIGIRDALLHKPGRLSPEEMEEMRQHVQHGRDIVSRSTWLRDALEIIGGHHERFDGTGYDQQLKGQDIPLVARIFAVADVFDALATARPYKKALPYEAAIGIMGSGRGSHFDSEVFDAFWPIATDLHRICSTSSSQELDATLRNLC